MMMEFRVFWPVALLLGLVIGSFLNLCIYRIPLGKSVVRGGSFCPACKAALHPRDLVPVLSWITLGGKCRYCKASIRFLYPAIELLSAGLFLLGFAVFGLTLMTPVSWAVASVLIVASAIDIKTFEIPDGASIALLIIGIATFFLPGLLWWERLLGAACAAGPLLLIVLASRGTAMGMGDVKLMAAAGLILGWQLSLFALFAAVIIGAAVGLILMAARKKGKKDSIPFVPMLSAGIFLSLLFGNTVIGWYLSALGI